MTALLKRVLSPKHEDPQHPQHPQAQSTAGSTVAAIRHPIINDQSSHAHSPATSTPSPTTTTPPISSSHQDNDKETAKWNRELQAIQQDRKRKIESAKQAAQEPPHIRNRYGPILPNHDINQTLNSIEPSYTHSLISLEQDGSLASTSKEYIGKRVAFTARIHTSRPLSSRLVFFLFRTQLDTIQGVLHFDQARISTHMLKWAQHLPSESIVHVTGTIQAPKNNASSSDDEKKVYSATIQDVEIDIESIHLLARARNLRFHVYQAEVAKKAQAQQIKEHKQQGAIGDGTTEVIQPDGNNDSDEGDQDDDSEDKDDDDDDDDEDIKSPRLSIATSTTSTTSRPTKSIQHISLRTRLANRIIDLRTPASLSIFRLQSALCTAFRAYLSDEKRGFMEIHTPKLQAGATESGSSVFRVDYFGRTAFLAQSPQLAKQMAISADFGRVFEIGPVFRAENSNTHRHLTEFTGLDMEMTIHSHYHEVMHTIDATLKHMFNHLYTTHRRELDIVQASFPHEDLVWLEQTPVLRFDEAVGMLNAAGWRDEDGQELREDKDLGTRDEIRLGQLVKEKYRTDYFIIDKFPASVRPFYAMPDEEDSKWTNSFDFFLRGQEILTGGQRIHQLKKLEKAMVRNGVQPDDMREYCEAFHFGAPMHGGAGIGLERLLMLLLQLGDIRNASLFPRDPQSIPAKPPPTSLRYPEASTLHPPWERAAMGSEDPLSGLDDDLDEDEVEGILREGGELYAIGLGNNTKEGSQQEQRLGQLQPLGKLIANFGSSTSTALFDDRYRIWRHAETGAAVSYVPVDRFAIVVGNPLCDDSQYPRVIRHFLGWLRRETRLRPIWILVDGRVEKILGETYGWCTLSCIAEERASTISNPAFHDAEVQRRVRHAEREGVKISDIPQEEEVPLDVRQECEEGMRKWLLGRKGKQAHLTQLNPWRDMEHRHYSFARDQEGRIVAMVVLAMLSKMQGYQVKYALDWEGAPSGTIEAITLHAVKTAASLGAQTITFGAGATSTIEAGHNIGKLSTSALRRTYKSIVASRGLARKTAFRAKMGADDSAPEDRLWIAYPKGGLGPRGIKALLGFFGDPKDEGDDDEEEEEWVEEGGGEQGEDSKLKKGAQSVPARAANALSKMPGVGSSEERTTNTTASKKGQSAQQAPGEEPNSNGSKTPSTSTPTANSTKHEDVASGKKQIVHSTVTAGGEKEEVVGNNNKKDADGITISGNDSSKARRRSTGRGVEDGNGNGKGNGKKRLSGILSSVFHRTGAQGGEGRTTTA
ncbi:hypothetical protein A4X13_0g4398 [Tilletia indica]|uniref:Probable aspartate--tRNA ligase, cytoplasmic n=1 Tax=Tilletia indica TaxID=43049 RepID=A0A177TMF8_9BASI|nr:hypothetical protein A4X13_0g4398 [Tilletia indica]